MKLGLEVLLEDKKSLELLKNSNVGLVAHPASVLPNLYHTMDVLSDVGVNLTCLFGPQHGIRGEKQDNMIESDDFTDPKLGVPTFSLYGQVRRPTVEMMDHFDILLFDLQDVGCRIYTFLTTLFYLIEDLSGTGKSLWVLDRPNPAGRPVEGNILKDGFYSFVGGGAVPMRHGLTLAEAAHWFLKGQGFDTDLKVFAMQDYYLDKNHQWGWPDHLPWLNPSPNLPTLSGCRVYPGSVLVEGTHLSEGRGTTRPLEVIGAPMLNPEKLVSEVVRQFEPWTKGVLLRPCYFEPTFHKFQGELCAGVQIHADNCCYQEEAFQPYRFVSAVFHVIHQLHPEFTLFKDPPYEYEEKLLPIEILSGSSFLKSWVEKAGSIAELDSYLRQDEARWVEERQEFLLY